MTERIHGHEVIEMIVQSGKSYTRYSLRNDIVNRFGPLARFYTCSADDLTADELIAFLEARGKFRPAQEGFTIDQSQVCKH